MSVIMQRNAACFLEDLGVKSLLLLVCGEVNSMLASIAFIAPTCEAELLYEIDGIFIVHSLVGL